MEIFRFFTEISPILLILRILTNQRLRKERSVHGACMGCILEVIEGLNSVGTHSDLNNGSWRYSGFSLQFRDFAHFEDLPNQRFRKEQSVQHTCMGCILEATERLNAVETESDLRKDSWR